MEVPPLLVTDRLGFMKPARSESVFSGKRRGPAPHPEDESPSPDQKSFHTPKTPTSRGRKQLSPRLIPPRTVWKPHPHRLIADRLGLMEPARGKSCFSGQSRGLAAPGDYKTQPQIIKFPRIYTSNTSRTNIGIPRSIAPRTVKKTTPIG